MNKIWFKIGIVLIIVISLSLVSLSLLAQVESDRLLKELLKGKTEAGDPIDCPSYEVEVETVVTVKDSCTGLVWASKELPTAKTANDANPGYSWTEAKDGCLNLLKYDGDKSLFRLPTVEELLTLVKYNCTETACTSGKSFVSTQQPLFASGIYWTINDFNEAASWSVNNSSRDYKRSVNLLNGEVDSPIFGQNFKLNALCIVDRQPEVISKYFTTVTTSAIDHGQAATAGQLKIRYNRQCTTETATAECNDKGVGTYCDTGYCAQEDAINFSATPVVASCDPDYHVEDRSCQPDSVDFGNKFWYGSLVNGLMDSCYNVNYHRDPVSNLCALNYRSCQYDDWYPNITAEQRWITTSNPPAWSACAVTQCVSSAIDNGVAWPEKECNCQSEEFFDGEKCNDQRIVSCETSSVLPNPELALTAERVWLDDTHQYSACYATSCVSSTPSLILSGVAQQTYCTCPDPAQHFENGTCSNNTLSCNDVYLNPNLAASGEKVWLSATNEWSQCYALTCAGNSTMQGSVANKDSWCACASSKHLEDNVCVDNIETCSLISTDKVCSGSSLTNGKKCTTNADCADGTCQLVTEVITNFSYTQNFARQWVTSSIGKCSGGINNDALCTTNIQCYGCLLGPTPGTQCLVANDPNCLPGGSCDLSSLGCLPYDTTTGWTQCRVANATSCKAGYLYIEDAITDEKYCAQQFVTVTGTVADAANSAIISNATITFTRTSDNTTASVTTNASGVYTISVIPGSYSVTVTHAEYFTYTLPTLTVTSNAVQNFSLNKQVFTLKVQDNGVVDDYYKVYIDDVEQGITSLINPELEITVTTLGQHKLDVYFYDSQVRTSVGFCTYPAPGGHDHATGFNLQIIGLATFLTTPTPTSTSTATAINACTACYGVGATACIPSITRTSPTTATGTFQGEEIQYPGNAGHATIYINF